MSGSVWDQPNQPAHGMCTNDAVPMVLDGTESGISNRSETAAFYLAIVKGFTDSLGED